MEKVTKPIVLNETFSEKLTTTNDFLSSIAQSCETISAHGPKVTTGTSADGSTTITVENKDGTITTKLVDGIARASVNTLSARMDTFTSLPEGSTSGNAELADIRVGADGTTYDTAGNAVRGQIGGLKSDLDDVSDSLSVISVTTFDSVETNKIYDRKDKNGLSYEGYDSYHKSVEPNKKYLITTTVVNNTNYSAVLFYGDGVLIGSAGDIEDVGSQRLTDYEFRTPIGTTDIIVTIANWVAKPSLKKKDVINANELKPKGFMNYVKIEDGVVSVKSKYNSSEDICFVFKQRGGNNLVDFDKVYTVQNNSDLNEDFTILRTLFNNSTDFFSPHVVSADTNRDGDNIDSYYFTGGNHRTTNTDVGGGVTAMTTSFAVKADKKEITVGEMFCNEIMLDWINEIQAFNTSKADGSGRAVLEEHITLSIVGNKINCKITHKAKEPIKRRIYYGLQALTSTYDTVRFIGGTNRKLCPTVSDGTQNSGGTTCRDIQIASASGDIINVHIYDTDLGDFSNCEKSFSAFNTGYGKSYFNVIMHEETPAFVMDTGDMTETCGYYEFASTN